MHRAALAATRHALLTRASATALTAATLIGLASPPASAADPPDIAIGAPRSVAAHNRFIVNVDVDAPTDGTAVLAASTDGRTYRTLAAWDPDNGALNIKVPPPTRAGTMKVRVIVTDRDGVREASRTVDVQVTNPYRPARPENAAIPIAGIPVTRTLFGAHAITGTPVPAGAIRLWDTATSWNKIEVAPGVFNWGNLDRRVATAKAAGQSVLLVLGGTPEWAVSAPPTGEEFAGRGSSMPPADPAWFERYVTAVMARYGTQIDAFEVWNEANIPQFWRGTPGQMADLTERAYRTIKKVNPNATVLAPSVGSRWIKGFTEFYPAFLAALETRGWPLDAYNVHLYPKASGNTKDRAFLLRLIKEVLTDAAAPGKPIWETEINYGITNPGTGEPGRSISEPEIAGYLGRTYLDSLRYGVARSYWYAWIPQYDLLGIQMFDGYPAATVYQRLQDWLVGSTFHGCSSTGSNVLCNFDRAGVPFYIAYSDATRPGSVPTPKGVTRMTRLSGAQLPVPASQLPVDGEPVLLN